MPDLEPPEHHLSDSESTGKSSAADVSAAAEEPFAQLFEMGPFPAVVSRLRDSAVLAINARTSEVFGVASREAVGLTATDYYVDPSQRERLVELVRRDGRAESIRLHVRRQNGDEFWALASSRLVAWHGEPAILTVFHDISEQLAAEQALKASERRLTAQSRALTELTARNTDPRGHFDDRLRGILEVAAQALQVERLSMWRFDDERMAIRCLGLYRDAGHRYESGALLRRDEYRSYFDALERDRVIAADDARTDPRTRDFVDSYLTPYDIGAMLDVPLRQNDVAVGVLCAEHIGGSRVWTIDEQNFAVATANLIVLATADEERRQAVTRLAESEALARLVVDTAHDAFIGIDATGLITTWNAQAERTFGWTRDEALGRSLVDTIIPPHFRDAHTEGMRRFLDSGAAPVVNRRLELAALDRSGREFPIELTITSPMRLESGYFFGAFLRDISDRREHDHQLRLAKETAEAATRAKSEFLANMSHELRTPLNGVLGYAQLLQRERNLSPSQREALDAISRCGAHLLELINDVLDLSKIEAGRVEIEASAVDLEQLTVDLRSLIAESAHRKGLSLEIVVASDVPRRVILDGRHLRQVLLNLLGNAIKFTAQGRVRLALARTDEERLAFEVADTGIGIEPEALAEIFEAFTQTPAGAAAGGTGLGLAISHHLIKQMGDELKVESAPGEGSRFFFALPLVRGGQPSASGPLTIAGPALDARLAAGQHVTALVADDSSVNRRILASLLESVGARVLTAAGGLEAVRLAREHRPDLIFMDIKMSDLDGLEATRRLGQDPATAGIPVVAVTASTFGDTRQAAREAGCVDYLPKPVRVEALFAVLQSHLGVRFDTAEELATPDDIVLEASRRPVVADQLTAAAAVGDVTSLERLAQELISGTTSEAALGQRIHRLVGNFDFEGLRELASAVIGADRDAS